MTMTAPAPQATTNLQGAPARRPYRQCRPPSAHSRVNKECVWLTIPIATGATASMSARRFIAHAAYHRHIDILAFHVSPRTADVLLGASSQDAILFAHDLLARGQEDAGSRPDGNRHILITGQLDREATLGRFRLQFSNTPFWGWWRDHPEMTPAPLASSQFAHVHHKMMAME